MIDNSMQVERLLGRLTEAVPFAARLSPALAAMIRGKAPGLTVSPECQVTWVGYAGDEGGIVCRLDLGATSSGEQFVVSLTHLVVRPGMLMAREISAYQKHRNKRLRRV